MMKAIKKITFALFISSILAFSGLAQDISYEQRKPKQDKPKEKVEEKKKDGGDRGGDKKDDRKKDKRPD